MRIQKQVVEGIVLKSQPFFEKDRLIEIFSAEMGRIRCLVRGGATLKKAGVALPLTAVQLQLAKGRNFFYVEQVELRQAFRHIRADLNRMMVAYYFIDVIMKATAQEQENAGLQTLLLSGLQALDAGKEPSHVRHAFQRQFLALEGLLGDVAEVVSDHVFLERFQTYSGKSLALPQWGTVCA